MLQHTSRIQSCVVPDMVSSNPSKRHTQSKPTPIRYEQYHYRLYKGLVGESPKRGSSHLSYAPFPLLSAQCTASPSPQAASSYPFLSVRAREAPFVVPHRGGGGSWDLHGRTDRFRLRRDRDLGVRRARAGTTKQSENVSIDYRGENSRGSSTWTTVRRLRRDPQSS